MELKLKEFQKVLLYVCILACPVKLLGLETSFNPIQIHQPIMLITISFDLLALSVEMGWKGRRLSPCSGFRIWCQVTLHNLKKRLWT